jgi:hypothetical protein
MSELMKYKPKRKIPETSWRPGVFENNKIAKITEVLPPVSLITQCIYQKKAEEHFYRDLNITGKIAPNKESLQPGQTHILINNQPKRVRYDMI